MNKKQFAMLASGIKSAYPASRILEDNTSMDFWFLMLQDIPYEIAENAVMEHICTSVYPPNIAEIRRLCAQRCQKPVPGFDEAWRTVQDAMAKYGSYNAEKALSGMDEITAEVVRNLGWERLCRGENQAADRANFREAYEARAKEARDSRQLPAFVAENRGLLQEKYAAISAAEKPKIAAESKKIAEKQSEITLEAPENLKKPPSDVELGQKLRRLAEMRRRLEGGAKDAG
ncbi:MAG: hypothetical protein LIO47_09855 [Akkermansia sp.]|nr:hypothetical protein [Akkermansia sp.]